MVGTDCSASVIWASVAYVLSRSFTTSQLELRSPILYWRPTLADELFAYVSHCRSMDADLCKKN